MRLIGSLCTRTELLKSHKKGEANKQLSDVVSETKAMKTARQANKLINESRSIDESVNYSQQRRNPVNHQGSQPQHRKCHTDMKLRRQPGTCFWCGDTRGPQPWQDCQQKENIAPNARAMITLETASPVYQPRQNPRQQFRPQRQQQSVNEVQQEHTEEDMVSSPPHYEDFDTYNLPGVPGNKFYANLQLTYRDKVFNHKFQIDSGASCKTMVKSVLTRAFPDMVMAKSKSVLRPYGKGPVIRPCGQI